MSTMSAAEFQALIKGGGKKPAKPPPQHKEPTMSAAEFQALITDCDKEERASKYGNKPVTIDGVWFQSTAEGEYYVQIKLRMRAGELSGYLHQVPYPIKVNGLHVCNYIADFVLFHADGRQEIIDVKGVETPMFRLKKKLLKATHGLDITLITKPKRRNAKPSKRKQTGHTKG